MAEARAGEIFPYGTRALALLYLFAGALSVWHNAFHLQQMDFISFWSAARLALAGHAAAAYDIEAHKAVQDQLHHFSELMPFPYPPPFLLMVLPIGLVPYVLATPLWIAGTYAVYFTAARRLLPQSGWLVAAFPPVMLNAINGQNGFLTAALFIAGTAMLPKRPFLAGMLLGCLVVKPQLGLCLPFAFIAARQWRAFAGAAVSSLGWLALALLAFGPQTYAAMLKIMPFYASIAADGLSGWYKMSSVYASLSLAGMPAAAAWAGHAAVAVAALVYVCLVWRSDCDWPARAAVLAAASVLVSPYMYIYDTVLLVVPFLWLAAREHRLGLLAGLWCVPLVSIAQSWGYNEAVNLMPLVPVALLLMIRRRLAAARLAQPEISGSTTAPRLWSPAPAGQ